MGKNNIIGRNGVSMRFSFFKTWILDFSSVKNNIIGKNGVSTRFSFLKLPILDFSLGKNNIIGTNGVSMRFSFLKTLILDFSPVKNNQNEERARTRAPAPFSRIENLRGCSPFGTHSCLISRDRFYFCFSFFAGVSLFLQKERNAESDIFFVKNKQTGGNYD